MSSLADKMRKSRQGKGWSMEDVAIKAGVNRSSVWATENGKSVSGKLLNRILDAMGIRGGERDAILSTWAMEQSGIAPMSRRDLVREDAMMALGSCPVDVVAAVAGLVRTRKGRETILAAWKQHKAPVFLED